MKREKISNLEKNGWKIGAVSEFLNLNPAEERHIELKLAHSKQKKS